MAVRFTGLGAALALILASLAASPAAQAQHVIRTDDAGQTLGRRVASAMQRATRHGGSAMVGYGIVVRAPADEIWGMYSLDDGSRPTLEELLGGRSIEDAQRVEVPGRIVERRAAVMIILDADGRPADVQLFTFNSIAHFKADTIWWVGDASLDESFDLLLTHTEARHAHDVRRGAVYSLARHQLPDRALPVLTGIIRDRSEPKELRKAAVYGLGMLGTATARRTLLDLIHDESS